MSCKPTIAQYMELERARKRELSDLIAASGLNFCEIAQATGTERRAVSRAFKQETVRYDTALRIEYYLEWYLYEKGKENNNL